jgi:hypothetical protein
MSAEGILLDEATRLEGGVAILEAELLAFEVDAPALRLTSCDQGVTGAVHRS